MVHHIPSSPLSQQSKSKEKPQLWKMTCLRPAPPSRSSLNQNEATPGSSNKRNSISAKPSARKGNFTHYFRGYLVKKSSLMLASFGLFGHRSWIQLLALTAGFYVSVTIGNFKKLQYIYHIFSYSCCGNYSFLKW
jgi:hypothetical protein